MEPVISEMYYKIYFYQEYFRNMLKKPLNNIYNSHTNIHDINFNLYSLNRLKRKKNVIENCFENINLSKRFKKN